MPKCPVCGYSDTMSARSISQLRLYWKLLTIVHENQTETCFPSPEALHEAVKEALGYVKARYYVDGTLRDYVPDSIAFGKMSQKKFNEFFDKVQDFVFTKIVPAVNREAFENELYNVLGMAGPLDGR